MRKHNIGKFISTLIFALVCMVFNVRSQQKAVDGINISGAFTDKVNGNLSLQYQKMGGGRMEFDSAKVVNGKFSFHKTTLEPVILSIMVQVEGSNVQRGRGGSGGGSRSRSFYLVPGEVLMTVSSNLQEVMVTGSGTIANADYQVLYAAENAYIKKQDEVNRTVPADWSQERKMAQWERNNDSVNLIRDDDVYLKTIKQNPKSLMAILALNRYASEPAWKPRKKMQPEAIEKLLATLPATSQAYTSLVALKTELQVAKATGPGKPIIDFTLKDTAGRTVKLSDFKGKYVFLDFWASWCVPCRKENPNVKAQYEKYKGKGFTVLSVSMDKAADRQAWLNAIEKDQIGMWTHLVDEAGFSGVAGKSYYVTSIPTNFLVGPDGKFIARNLYGKELDAELAKLFMNK